MNRDASSPADPLPDDRTSSAGDPPFKDKLITLSHGSGGKASHHLIKDVFERALGNPHSSFVEDSALLDINGTRVAMTTDSYVIDPISFPGGDIGKVAVNGTINDLCTASRPKILSGARRASVADEGNRGN